MSYDLEQNLVDDFVRCLPSSSFIEFEPFMLSREFDYQRGRTDIILLTFSSEVIAIEAKLKKWREALNQAYRNTCFAQYSYVLLTERVAKRALVYREEFAARNIGICYVDNDKIEIIHEAIKTEPLQYWLNVRAKDEIKMGGKNVALDKTS